MRQIRFVVIGLVGVFVSGCTARPALAPAPAPSTDARLGAADQAFRNAAKDPPQGWPGPTFKLSNAYPETLPPPCPTTVCTWLALGDPTLFSVDFTTTPPDWTKGLWREYSRRILAYVREGQDPQLADDVGFRAEVGGKTRWFHVPWMAYDPSVGREFVHGTTNERTAHLSDLVGGSDSRFGAHMLPTSSDDCRAQFPHGFETWSVGMYNEFGGWALGQAWPKNGEPQSQDYLGGTMPAGLPFPPGTVVTKVLTTNAPVSCAKYLQGAPEWRLDRHQETASKQYSCDRDVQVSRVLQVDIAVVDSRSPTRWVYATFAFNGGAPGATFWDKLIPLGLQWGADPWTFPAVPKAESVVARQSVLNPSVGIFEHQGCNGRLAGPVDNKESSCLSCHGSAYAPSAGGLVQMGVNTPSAFGFDGNCTQYSAQNAAYFQNQTPPQGYPGGAFPRAMSLDTSLQMFVALQQYGQFNTAGKPVACTNPDQF